MAAPGHIGDNRLMSERSLVVVFAASLLAAAAPAARADVLTLTADAQGGGMGGTGTGGDQKANAFFAKAPHIAYGAQVGVKFLVFDVWIRHHQYTSGSRLATWTAFGTGLDTVIDLGDRKKGENTFVQLAMGLWFGLGTGQQVALPLDNAQISDKGFLGEAAVGFGTHLSSSLDLGVTVPVSYGYFFKSGNGATANNLSTHYQGAEAEALLYLRLKLKLL
jgi:hypothetical protein